MSGDPYEDYLDRLEDPEEYREWHHPKNQATHTCKGCRARFKANKARGPLAYCDRCADLIEQGREPPG